MAICTSANWVLATLFLVLSYTYYLSRMMLAYDNVPHELILACCEVCCFYALGAYLTSRILFRELSANFEAEESSKEFKQFLKCLPEGVSIVDHENSDIKFYNSRLREKFDINSYCESGNQLDQFLDLKAQIDKEFDNALRNVKEGSCESSLGNQPFRILMKKFKIINKFDINTNRVSSHDMIPCFKDLSPSSSFLVKKQKIGNPDDITLLEFLHKERELLRNQDDDERETKISLYLDDFNFINGVEIMKREFVIKTRRVSRTSPENPKTSMFLHIFSDTTQITELEEQRAQNKYQKQMLANVSHEFRTPLNAMSISLFLLRSKIIRGPQQKFLKIASSSCDILRFLVEDILDHAKIESGVFEIKEEIFKVSKLLDEIEDIFELQANQKKIALRFHAENEIADMYIKTDKQRLKQVLMNLVSNSLKFTDRGSIRVYLERNRHEECKQRSRNISNNNLMLKQLNSTLELSDMLDSYAAEKPQIPRVVSYMRHPDNNDYRDDDEIFCDTTNSCLEPNSAQSSQLQAYELTLTVIDSGIGIPKRDQSSLFKLFGKTSSNHDRNKTGCGLGLTICKKILHKLGGDIKLESEEGKGTKVTCTFNCTISSRANM
ncbi:unnamed protein product [Moneuplotes crassus]|uniref:histidine kinase n=1 Tax=Euplotes crassus TaxID=5936 RepID=A0AAD1XMC5_EUPCR|nr:unnamed protein product [Moneuplotes crassus]